MSNLIEFMDFIQEAYKNYENKRCLYICHIEKFIKKISLLYSGDQINKCIYLALIYFDNNNIISVHHIGKVGKLIKEYREKV